MNVGLIDVDMKNTGKRIFPTLTLMKLSAYHKAKGDCVTLLSVDQYLNYKKFKNGLCQAQVLCINKFLEHYR